MYISFIDYLKRGEEVVFFDLQSLSRSALKLVLFTAYLSSKHPVYTPFHLSVEVKFLRPFHRPWLHSTPAKTTNSKTLTSRCKFYFSI